MHSLIEETKLDIILRILFVFHFVIKLRGLNFLNNVHFFDEIV